MTENSMCHCRLTVTGAETPELLDAVTVTDWMAVMSPETATLTTAVNWLPKGVAAVP